jgi:hypothetical protein
MQEEMPFEELQKISKVDTARTLSKEEKEQLIKQETKRMKQIASKRTASMPAEVSSKIPVSRKRQDILPTQKRVRCNVFVS